MIENKNQKKPLVAFMPYFYDLGETFPLLEIAKKYRAIGGEAIFVGYGNKYKKLAEEIGYKIVEIRPKISENMNKIFIHRESKYSHKKTAVEKFLFTLFDKKIEKLFIEMIEEEIRVFKNEKVGLVVTSFNITSNISARVMGIPVVFLISGVSTPRYFESNCATFPDSYENFFTRLIPQPIKNRITNFYVLKCKWGIKGYNKLARTYNVPMLKHFLDIFAGDYALVADDIELLGLKPDNRHPLKNFVGPILFDQPDITKIDPDVESHLEKPGKSVLLSMGGNWFWRKFFLDVLKILNQTKYNVVAICSVLEENEIPELNDNILFKKFVPSIKKVNEMVDLAITHGGRGTVYTAAYSGKPVIGIPMMAEQQFNLDNLVRRGMAIRLSKKYFTEKKLLNSIDEIFDNYDKYLKNAQLLKNKLSEPKGAENAAKRILEIINAEMNK
jgi:UDP:flavonoid glycosyltransferase YjiC (YdhE family)